MKVYLAGPLFTTPERTWNAEVTAALRAAGHEVFMPQENEPGKDAAGIFAADKAGIDWADGLVAIMDGPAPDAVPARRVDRVRHVRHRVGDRRGDVRGCESRGRGADVSQDRRWFVVSLGSD